MSSNQDFPLDKTIPVFDGANFLEWQAQTKGFLQLKGWWHIITGIITRPAVAGADQTAWDNADEMALGAITLKLVHTLHTGMVVATAAATWTALNINFARTEVSAVYQNFKAQ
jgi:hypothetical protein